MLQNGLPGRGHEAGYIGKPAFHSTAVLKRVRTNDFYLGETSRCAHRDRLPCAAALDDRIDAIDYHFAAYGKIALRQDVGHAITGRADVASQNITIPNGLLNRVDPQVYRCPTYRDHARDYGLSSSRQPAKDD